MRSRRGLSTVVGAVFAVIAITSTVAYVSFSMNTLNQYNNAVITKNQILTNTNQEKLQITSVTVPNNKFNITVANTGNLPANITKIWIQNTTATDWDHGYGANGFVSPGGILTNLGQTLPIVYNPANAYNVKLVTTRGNTYQFSVNSAMQSPMSIQLVASPGSVPTGFQTTLLMIVSNNSTSGATMTNISPGPLNVVSNTGVTAQCGNPSPASYSSIPSGSTRIFQWTCTLSGNVGTAITYNATLQNGYNHNYATTTATIGNVLFAAQSASSVSAQGFNPLPTSDSVLLFDQNQFNAPYGGYQMFNTQTDNSTNTFLSLDGLGGASFYTNNGTALTINPGKWNATLRYISAPVPTGNFSTNQYPDVVYHFENSLANSMASNPTLSSGNGASYSAGSGVNGTGAYPLSGTMYLYSNVASGYTNIPSGSVTTNTAMWFKTTSSTHPCQSATCTLLRIGDSNSGPFYLIYIYNRVVYFKYSDHSSGGVDATCTGTKPVDEGKWHYLVVERTSNSGCTTYVDGSQDAKVSSGSGCGSSCGTVGGHFDLGRDQAAGGNYFPGTIDDVMHWNGNNGMGSLSLTQIHDLMYTSYGANAHTATINIYQTNYDGTCSSGNGGLNGGCTNVISTATVQLPFMDGGSSNSYSNPSASGTWGHYNYTVTLPTQTFTSTQRLEFQIKFVPQTHGQLGMKMIIDNSNLNDQYGQSLLQTATPTSPFMGYLAYNANTCNGSHGGGWNSDNVVGQVYTYNAGPDIAWVEQGSRVIFMSYDKSSAYGSIVYFQTGGWGGWSSVDSAAIPVGASQLLYFSTPFTQPGLQGYQGGTLIPQGNYKMYVYLNGYDEEGHSLLSTDYMGPVRVYYTDTQC